MDDGAGHYSGRDEGKMTERSGKFIVLEGIDGSGTTTQAQRLANYLFEKDKKNIVVLTREPTKLSPYGIELRRRLAGTLFPEEEKIDDPAYWVDLFINDRKWHLDQVVVPAVRAGLQVVSDRHKLSTIAYQSAQGADMDKLIRRHEGMYPADLTLLLDCPAEAAAARMQKDRGAPEYFENLGLQKKVRENYLLAAEGVRGTEKIITLDGSLPLIMVTEAIQKEIEVLYRY